MSKKILLADDSITIQKVIELTFSDEDFDVITVGNGRLALERLPDVRPDIVLCDIIMPEKDGYEVCEQIKTNPATSHVPVLLLTGAFEPFDQERAARAGYDGSLAKPFEPETLIAKVKDLLARAPARSSAPPVPASRAADAPPPPVVVAPPPVLPFQRPAPPAFAAPAAPHVEPAVPSFIPEEPFGGLDESAFAGTASAPVETFAPVTEEESATLLAPPPVPAPADAASTVMFNAGELPWNASSAPRSAEPPRVPALVPPQMAGPARQAAASPGREPEPLFVPEAAETAEVAEEPAVFEEVLEEDLDFGEASFDPGPTETSSGTLLFTPGVATLPPIPPGEDGGATGAFEPVTAGGAPPLEPEPVLEHVPESVLEPEPATVLESEPSPAFEPEPVPAFEPEPFDPGPPLADEPAVEKAAAPLSLQRQPEVRFAPAPPVAPEPVRARPAAEESFADVAAAVAAPTTPPAPSESAALSVPVEMVEKIAQRVVAQISEKAVREIAWEVIPDLAEALIKQEIERLKAELQKT
jgi:CheY-like chemotaxis protein